MKYINIYHQHRVPSSDCMRVPHSLDLFIHLVNVCTIILMISEDIYDIRRNQQFFLKMADQWMNYHTCRDLLLWHRRIVLLAR